MCFLYCVIQLEDVEGGSTNFTTISGLSAGLEYFFSVQAYNGQGRSKHSAPAVPVILLGESASTHTHKQRQCVIHFSNVNILLFVVTLIS